MNESPYLQDQWQKSTVRRFLGWLFSWHGVRALLISVAAMATLIGLFYAVENWRGSSAWRQCRQELEAQGEKLDFRDFIPPPVPDDQNLVMIPLLKPVITRPGGPSSSTKWNLPERFAKITATEGKPGRSTRSNQAAPKLPDVGGTNLFDLAAWQAFYRGNTNYPQPATPQSPAADVLVALSRFDTELKELQEGASRPYARFPVPYMDEDPFAILLPHLAKLKSISVVLTLRATARLELGQAQPAWDDLKLGLRLADTLKQEPLLISHLVRIASFNITLQGVREGLARHAWSEAQLAEMEKLLGSVDLLAEHKWVMRGERAWCLAGLDWWSKGGSPEMDLGLPEESSLKVKTSLARFVPTGWMLHNKASIARLHQQFSLAVVDEKAGRVFPEKAQELDQAFKDMRPTPYNIFAKLLIPAVSKVSMKSARCQTQVNHAVVACALERYRLAHGQIPENLEVLVPQFIPILPHDLIGGTPLHYRRETDGGYMIYSTGWNQKDDGGQSGTMANKRGSSQAGEDQQGDWVWRCPAK